MTYLGFIEFFQDSRVEVSATELLKNPVRSDILTNAETIRFKNRIGTFLIKKENDLWILKEPRVMPAQVRTVNSLIQSLRDIKVQTIHEYEPINIQSFSLDKPIIQIDLTTKLDDNISIKVGIINPIDNTSYITVTGHDYIFQTNIFKTKMERYELSRFIDSRIFSMNIDNVKEFSLYRGKSKETFNKLSQKNSVWSAKKYNTISSENTSKKLTSILNITTHMIIDKQDEELKTFITNYLDNPLYRITVRTFDNKQVTYKVSNLVKAIKDLKIEKRQYFLVSSSDRKYPYVINKQFLNEFVIKYSDLK